MAGDTQLLLKSRMLKRSPTSSEIHFVKSFFKFYLFSDFHFAAFAASEAKLKPWRISLLFLFTLTHLLQWRECVSSAHGCQLGSVNSTLGPIADAQKLMLSP